MSTIILRMKQQKMSELGEHIKEGLRHFGKAMSLYEEMESMCEGGEMEERRGGMRYPEGMDERMYPHMRYPEMDERRYRRY